MWKYIKWCVHYVSVYQEVLPCYLGKRVIKMALCDNCSPKRWCSADKSRTECRFYQPMTNEEWFASLTTEEKVKALLNLHERVRRKMRTDIGGENSFYKGEYYREWLKEKHE